MAGRQGVGGRAGRWGKSISLMFMREIFYILQKFINRWWIEKRKKCEKNMFPGLHRKKCEIGGLTIFFNFFSIKGKTGIPKRSPAGTKRTCDVLAM